ncbi:D-glycero-beta-D-manno-heptose 1-phosphate adenylyltransferase [Olivibacter sitiensis]|uniref:D-glycero-beta-D-manno-heptose 1-phosphate adenylyltransferase n=1 Tax=Olivibacter sitiensis TaxID=376470 RepID=UPI000417174E|nr:D-glycero-beta-D-manno-heptose 1-phosphate adenylyltransferase [Olivibacter sitiensis]
MATEIDKLLDSKFLKKKDAVHLVKQWKSEGKHVVFTNGCFDLLHPGHLNYLLEAANLGDKLVIGLNADASVSRLKGPTRPVNNERNRAAILAALYFVDMIVLFEEDTPLELIQSLSPDVLVKGGDYNLGNIVGAREVLANGGEVKVLKFLEGYSSSSLIAKIRQP